MSVRKASRLFASAPLVLLLISCASSQPSSPRVQHIQGTFHHVSAMDFPVKVGDFTRMDITQFPGSPNNFGIGYELGAAKMAEITVFVYSAPGSNFDSHFELNDATSEHKVGPVQQSAIEVNQNGETIRGRAAVWEYAEPYGRVLKQIPLRSRTFLFQRGQWFVKYRITNPAAADQFIREHIEELMTALRMPGA